jgi:hypothetical protein
METHHSVATANQIDDWYVSTRKVVRKIRRKRRLIRLKWDLRYTLNTEQAN